MGSTAGSQHFANPYRAVLGFTSVVRANSFLIWEMTKRSIRDRYAGQFFGKFWMLFHPILLVSIYIFLFGLIFNSKLRATGNAGLDNFVVYILSGIIPWLCLLEVMTKAPTVITSQVALVKQVVFPLDVLPIVNVTAALVSQAVMFGLFLIYSLVFAHGLHTTLLLFPVLVALQVILLLGLSFGLAGLGVYLRDLKDLVAVFSSIGIYLAPVVYDPEWVPSLLRPLLFFNPFSYMIWCFQDVFYFGRIHHPAAWIIFPLFSLVCFVSGFALFRRVRPYFGSAL